MAGILIYKREKKRGDVCDFHNTAHLLDHPLDRCLGADLVVGRPLSRPRSVDRFVDRLRVDREQVGRPVRAVYKPQSIGELTSVSPTSLSVYRPLGLAATCNKAGGLHASLTGRPACRPSSRPVSLL